MGALETQINQKLCKLRGLLSIREKENRQERLTRQKEICWWREVGKVKEENKSF